MLLKARLLNQPSPDREGVLPWVGGAVPQKIAAILAGGDEDTLSNMAADVEVIPTACMCVWGGGGGGGGGGMGEFTLNIKLK